MGSLAAHKYMDPVAKSLDKSKTDHTQVVDMGHNNSFCGQKLCTCYTLTQTSEERAVAALF